MCINMKTIYILNPDWLVSENNDAMLILFAKLQCNEFIAGVKMQWIDIVFVWIGGSETIW